MQKTNALRPYAVLAALVLLLLPLGAQASPETLKRSVSNLTMFPLDFALSPIVAGKTLVTNLRNVDDSWPVRIVYPIPGFVWLTCVQGGASLLRGISGVLELLPGLGLLFSESDLAPLFDPAERNAALVDYDALVLHIKFGIDYTTTPTY